MITTSGNKTKFSKKFDISTIGKEAENTKHFFFSGENKYSVDDFDSEIETI